MHGEMWENQQKIRSKRMEEGTKLKRKSDLMRTPLPQQQSLVFYTVWAMTWEVEMVVHGM